MPSEKHFSGNYFVGPTYPTNYMHMGTFMLTVKRLHSKDYLVFVPKHMTITKIVPLQPLRKLRRQKEELLAKVFDVSCFLL